MEGNDEKQLVQVFTYCQNLIQWILIFLASIAVLHLYTRLHPDTDLLFTGGALTGSVWYVYVCNVVYKSSLCLIVGFSVILFLVGLSSNSGIRRLSIWQIRSRESYTHSGLWLVVDHFSNSFLSLCWLRKSALIVSAYYLLSSISGSYTRCVSLLYKVC